MQRRSSTLVCFYTGALEHSQNYQLKSNQTKAASGLHPAPVLVAQLPGLIDVLVRPPGMLRRWDDSQKYLSDHPHLVREETADCLVAICVDFEVEEVSVRGTTRTLGRGRKLENRSCASAETRPDGAGGPPGHRHEIHPGSGADAAGGPERLLQTLLLKDEGGQQVLLPLFHNVGER